MGAMALAMLGYVGVTMPDPYAALWEQHETFLYGFQLPFALFLSAMLGAGFGAVALLLYVMAGLFFLPLFAGGGGLDYLTQPGVGYFLGMMAGGIVGNLICQKAFVRKDRCGRSVVILLASTLAVLIAHSVGSLFLVTLGLAGWLPWDEFSHWWIQYTGSPLAYDLLTAMAMFCLIRLTRLGLWLAIY
jgi:biotin transport system substrate-specific component